MFVKVRRVSLANCLSAAVLLSAGCDRLPNDHDTVEATDIPVAADARTAPTPSSEQLTALAFRAAWGAPPPVTRTEDHADYNERTYRSGQLVPLGGTRFAFVSSGDGGESHASAGSLSIHYLTRTADGFRLEGGWPGLIVSGTFGNPPDWGIRTDLMPSPVLVAEAGGTWQGYSCGWAHLVELTPSEPIVRVQQINMHYESSGALGDAGEEFEARILPGARDRTIYVEYSGDYAATVTYARVGAVYDPVDMPELPWC